MHGPYCGLAANRPFRPVASQVLASGRSERPRTQRRSAGYGITAVNGMPLLALPLMSVVLTASESGLVLQ
jgi:hypothetical protein